MNMRITYFTLLVMGTLICSVPVCGQTPESLMEVHEAFAQAMNDHDLDGMMSFFTEDALYDLVNSPPPADNNMTRMGFGYRFATYPDFHTDEGRRLTADNIIVVEHNALYTHPNGNAVVSPHLDIYEFEGDKIKKVTTYSDKVRIAVQVGSMPAPETPNLVPTGVVPGAEPTGLSPLEANAELIRRWNSHDAAAVAKMDHDDVQIFAGPLGMHIDRAQMMVLNEQYFVSFPDDLLEVVRTIDLGDGWVLTELVSKATHMETFMGVPASGYLMNVRVVWLTQFDADGLVVDMSFYYDSMTLITQMTTPEWSLDGIWVTSYPTPLGNLLTTTVYAAQDETKTQYSGTLEWLNVFPVVSELYPDSDPSLGLSAGGQATKVGRHQYTATFLGYERTSVGALGGIEIVGIWIAHANFELTGPDQLQGYGTVSYYMAAQDVDQDGFPDADQEPIACVPWQWSGRRITAVPACTPSPMPDAGVE